MKTKTRVIELLKEIDSTHRYSMSRIYGVYNEVFGVAEVPQACASCLIRKANQLREWLKNQQETMEFPSVKDQPVTVKRGRKKKSSSQ